MQQNVRIVNVKILVVILIKKTNYRAKKQKRKKKNNDDVMQVKSLSIRNLYFM